MITLSHRLVGALALCAAVSVLAQPAASPVIAQFKQFFTPIAGEWRCHIREWNGTNADPVWQDHQLRRFEWSLANEFVQETAYAWHRRQQKWFASGLHLFGADAANGTVVESGFWAGMSPEGFRVVLRFEADGRELTGTMNITAADGKIEARRCVFTWEGDAKFFFRVYRSRPDGSGEYLHEELAYERGAFPPPAVPAAN